VRHRPLLPRCCACSGGTGGADRRAEAGDCTSNAAIASAERPFVQVLRIESLHRLRGMKRAPPSMNRR
jgi:hypothetical protein